MGIAKERWKTNSRRPGREERIEGERAEKKKIEREGQEGWRRENGMKKEKGETTMFSRGLVERRGYDRAVRNGTGRLCGSPTPGCRATDPDSHPPVPRRPGADGNRHQPDLRSSWGERGRRRTDGRRTDSDHRPGDRTMIGGKETRKLEVLIGVPREADKAMVR